MPSSRHHVESPALSFLQKSGEPGSSMAGIDSSIDFTCHPRRHATFAATDPGAIRGWAMKRPSVPAIAAGAARFDRVRPVLRGAEGSKQENAQRLIR